jgi:alpha-tubulin suppressor-like RCC1 family protein
MTSPSRFQRTLTTIILAFYAVCSVSAQTSSTFTASNFLSDSKVILNWDLSVLGAHKTNNPEVYFQIRERQSKEEVFSERIDSINNYDTLSGSFTIFIVPNSAMEYEIRLMEYGPGTVLMDQIYAIGRTNAYQAPEITANAINPWDIDLSMKSNSDYDTKMLLYRSGQSSTEQVLISVLDTSVKSYLDICDPAQSGSIVNGETYTYTLVSINDINQDSVTATQSAVQSTYRVNFNAQKNSSNGLVQLTWSDLNSYVNKVIIKRDGSVLMELDGSIRSYDDKTAIPGFAHKYSFILYMQDISKLILQDTGSIIPNGILKGTVFNSKESGDFTVPGVKIVVTGKVAGEDLSFETITDELGNFEVLNIAYHTATSFTVSATMDSTSFETNDQEVTLNLDDPSASVQFIATTKSEKVNKTIDLNTFTAVSSDSLGHVKLSWDITSTDTVYFYIYRNDRLIRSDYQVVGGANDYVDLEGTPLSTYTYSMRAYSRVHQIASSKFDYYFTDERTSSALFPQPRAIAQNDFTTSILVNKGSVEMAWSHPQGNINGFRIYRNDELIKTLDKYQLSFQDVTGVGGTKYTYSMNCFLQTNDGQVHNSSKVFGSSVNFPILAKPNNLAQSESSNGMSIITWEYNVESDYNFDGFRVLRQYDGSTKVLGNVRKTLPKTFQDASGVPGRFYAYSVQAYKENLDSRGNASDAITVKYPELPKLKSALAYSLNEGAIAFEATLDSQYSYLDIAIQNAARTITHTIDQANVHTQTIAWNNYSNSTVDFVLVPVKEVDGVKYFGNDTTHVPFRLSSNGPYDLDTVTSLTASSDLSSHVKLCWEYPDFYVPEFHIYRDGYLLEIVEGVHKTYYDNSVHNNDWHLYQVQVHLGEGKSRMNGAVGRITGKTRIVGSSYAVDSKQGIANTTVKLYLPDDDHENMLYHTETLTDSTGYYEFVNVPTKRLQSGTSTISLVVENSNARFEKDEIITVFYDSIGSYIIDFKDTLPSTIIPSDSIAKPTHIKAVANLQNHSVDIRWQSDNGNYTSFEVYRGLSKIATIDADQPKFVQDDGGLPGYDYAYRIRAIWEKDQSTTEEGEYYSVIQLYPQLLPVRNLNYTLINDAIRLNWSHPVDAGIDYFVLRNGQQFDIIKSGENLELIDKTGVIGSAYKYSVIPALANNHNIQGIEISLVALYPKVASIKDIQPSSIENGQHLTWQSPSERSEIYILYSNGNCIDTIVDQSTGSISYDLYDGVPETMNTFEVSSGYYFNDRMIIGKRTKVSYYQYNLVSPFITTNPVASGDKVNINSEYIYRGISGIEFWRNSDSLGTTSLEQKQSTGYSFDDKKGLPLTYYGYKARVYSVRNGVKYYSNFWNTVLTQFPALSTPTQVVAKDSNGIYRILKWSHNREDITFNVVSYKPTTASSPTSVTGNVRQYLDDEAYFGTEISYGVQAVLTHGSSEYKSDYVQSNSLYGQGNSLYCWGYNAYGQVGNGSTSNSLVPFIIDDNAVWIQVVAGYNSSYAVKDDGSLWAWGNNSYGQLGNGGTAHSATPVQIGTDLNWNRIICGPASNTVFAFKNDGRLYCWGSNGNGQLGLGHTAVVSSPVQFGNTGVWKTIATGGVFTVGIKQDGTIWTWGYNFYGSLGQGPITPYTNSTPDQVGSNSDWNKVSAGQATVMAIKTNGTMWGWGDNYHGTIGIGNYLDQGSPIQAGSASNWISVSCGYYHTLAQNSLGAYSTGHNYHGQLINGSTLTNFNTFSSTSSSPYISQIATGGFFSFVKISGRFYGQGNNTYGQLGNGGTDKDFWDVERTASQNWSDIRGGYNHSIGLLNNPTISNLQASDGIGTKVFITWNALSTSSYKNVLIYRDGILIANEDASKTRYVDLDAFPGMKHVYSARAERTNSTLTGIISDIGWREASSNVKGSVLSFTGNQPVPDVNIYLKVSTEEGNFYDTTISDANGNFRFDKVYTGHTARATVTAKYLDHEFVQDTLSGDMDKTVTSLAIGAFIDKTAYLLSGIVTRHQSDCRLDSVPITLIKHYASSDDVEELKFTDESGFYTYSVNPFETDLVSFELELAESSIQNGDTILYDWDRNNVVIDKVNVNTVTPLENFRDMMSVRHDFSIRNSCNTYQGIKFSLDIESIDGCFSTTVLSNDNGVFPAQDLPPLEYLVSIAGASTLTSDIIPVIEYLKVRPVRLDLTEYNINEKRDSTKQNLFTKEVAFFYHNSPQISLTKGTGIGNVACNPSIYFVRGIGDPDYAEANLDINVSETHNGVSCHVTEGFLILKNNATDASNIRLDFDPVTGTFPRYTFNPGVPETIAPYYKTLTVEYHTITGFVSQDVYQILVTGKAAQPGSDVIVQGDDKSIQMPLAILRDPPGDNSYSYLEKGVESTKSFSVDRTFGGSLTLSASNQFSVIGIGVEVSASAQVGGSEGNRDEISFSQTTTQRFETSAESDIQNSSGSEYFVGDNADIIMGTGMALKYGIVESISYNETDTACKVLKSTEIGISPDNLTTTWTYTVSHIKALVAEYENLLKLVREGRVEINSTGGTQRDSTFYKTLIANWNNVLKFHSSKTLPHYNLCDKEIFDEIFDEERVEFVSRGLATKIDEAATSYRDCFCDNVGNYEGGTFAVNTGFKWTDDALTRYKVARMKINELSTYFKRLEKQIVAGPGYTPPSLAKFDNNLEALKGTLTDEDNLYAENITFSGQTSVEKSFSNAYTTTQAYTQQIYGGASLYAGILFRTELDVSTWGGIGAGVEVNPVTLLEGQIKAGAEISFDFNIENSVETSTTTTKTSGYVLGDDDAGDQFSVTVIKGLEQMHTPYFELFAGRSSCPYEPGTIPRDQPEIQLEYPDGSPFENNVLRDVDVSGPAYYSLKLVNKAPEIFNEFRYYYLVQAANSNQNGAGLTYPLVSKVKSGGSTYTGFYANKAANSYDYPDLDLQIIPTCLDKYSDLTNGFDGAELHMEAYFERPCSDVSILSPQDNWRIFKSLNEFGKPAELLQVNIGDYDPYNEFLEKITLNYRRIGSSVWTEIPGLSISKDSLQTFYELYRTTYKDPTYTFIWDIKDRSEIIDGEYELQAVVHCGIEGLINSNVVKGKIDRSSLQLFGTPKPTDGVLNIGENVQVIFNEPIECGYERKDSHYLFVKKSNKEVLDFTSICNGNSIIYEYNGDLSLLDKQIVEMMVFDVQDLNGNVLEDTIKYEFMVSYSPIAVQPQAYEIEMYKGDVKQLEINLVNTGTALARVELSRLGNPNQLLNLTNLNDSVYGNSSLRYAIALNAKGIDIGTYSYTVSIDVSTDFGSYGTIEVPIRVNVLAEAPDWKIPFGKSQSTVVVCNFKIDDVQSTDTLDKVAITIDGEVRGFDNIYKSKAGNNLYYAVINVQGDAVDQGKNLEYRIWDASKGAEFDGYMTDGAVTFNNGIFGTTLDPRIIEVETEWDSVRYIPLIQGWNWLALNYQKESMTVDNMISGLKLTGGEIIKTLTQQAIYNDSTDNWFATGSGLNAINTADGYMLYLHQDDVLRVSGKDADLSDMSIINGWSLIGNPHQANVDINNVFETNTDLKNGAILKTGGAINKASVLEDGSWTGGIQEYETNQSYMIKNSTATDLKLKRDDVSQDRFEYNMTILGSVLFDGGLLHGDGDYVIAEIDGELRGKGLIEEVQTTGLTYMLNMFIYGDTSDIGKRVNFKIYRSNSDEYYTAFTNDSLYFKVNDHKGGPNSPYWFANRQETLGVDVIASSESFNVFAYPNPFKSHINVDVDAQDNGVALVTLYDIFGKQVQNTKIECLKGENNLELRTGILSDGIYILRVELNGVLKSSKLLKQ